MTRSILRASLLTSAAMLGALYVMPVHAEDPTISPTGTRLDISAQSSVKSNPDVAVLNVAVVTKAPTAEAVRDENAKKMTAAFALLKAKKISPNDYQTSGINLNPDYVYEEKQPPKISGYQAVNNLTIKLHKLDQVSEVIDALVGAGINQISGPTFSIDDPETLLNKARQDAIKKAAARAGLYAQATGLKVQRIVAISENSNVGVPPSYPMMKAMRMEAGASDTASTPVAPGQVDLDVTVNVTYELGK